MPSIVPGFEYDIFISYRQKDNRSDKWVTNFVKALREELDATFKEDISIYFDENPHDGLTETHNVGKSLEGKLRCLIFIPIISQTYCDLRSFAWQHEFCAFVSLARKDDIGLDVKLKSGNVNCRVLPVKIHDLDADDQKLIEAELGAVLRPVEFIFRSPGVNRPLTSRDDDAKEINHALFYRDQVNKLANVIKDLLQVIKRQTTTNASNSEPHKVSAEHQAKLSDGVSKRTPVSDASQSATGIKRTPGREKKFLTRKVWFAIFIGLLAVSAGFYFGIGLVNRWETNSVTLKVEKIAREASNLPSIEREGKSWEAYKLVTQTKNLSGNNDLLRKWLPVSQAYGIKTEPAGAQVSIKPYSAPDEPWTSIGQTPIDSVQLPFGAFRIKLERKGYATQEDAIAGVGLYQTGEKETLAYSLITPSELPEGMVLASGDSIDSYNGAVGYGDYFIDRFEVTNKAYKQFVDAGGYKERKFWKQNFVRDGKSISWEEAVRLFTDKTGRPGPSGWVAGGFPNGEENFPVCGVSWYEAAAYAEFAGKSLPTIFHFRNLSMPWANAEILSLSNINGSSRKPVGTLPGMTRFGTYDIAGNVREWVFNAVQETGNRMAPGGAWSDDQYVYGNDFDSSPFDRAEVNGFRCMKIRDNSGIGAALLAPAASYVFDMSKRKPVTDEQYELMKRMYDYESGPIAATVVYRKNVPDCILEKIRFPTVYGKDSLIVYLFLPKNAKPPYQTIVYYPGAGAFIPVNSEKFIDALRWDGLRGLEFLIKTGRAVLFPIYYGTMERYDPILKGGPTFAKPHQGLTIDREKTVKIGKDFRRCVDYLESRDDIDSDRLGYLGFSQGGGEGAIMLAIEKRIKTAVLVVCGLTTRIEKLPESDRASYLPRVRQPVLMLNSSYDWNFPYKTAQKPFFDLLGTPAEDKKLILYNESGHEVPWNPVVTESLNWFDHYLGEVNHDQITATRN